MNDLASKAMAAVQAAAQQPEAQAAAQQPEAQAAAQQRGESPAIRKLFILMHGSYGSLFVSKFATGEKDANGKDKGVRAAMIVWEHTLGKYPIDVIETACSRCIADHPKFPPNLPEFEALCKAVMPRKTAAEELGLVRLPPPAPVHIEVTFERKGDNRDWAREIAHQFLAGAKMSPTKLSFAIDALRTVNDPLVHSFAQQ